MADLDEDKLKVAERLGATCVVNSSKENVAAVVAAVRTAEVPILPLRQLESQPP